MQLPEHRLFLGTNMDDMSVDISKHKIYEMYIRQQLRSESEIKSSVDRSRGRLSYKPRSGKVAK